jgi:hypothetical protein
MDSYLSSQQKEISSKDKAIILGILFVPCILINQILNNDMWFILNNGRYVFQHGIPYIEPFTLHKGLSYVMQQWLSSVIFWATYSKLGTAGLSILIIIMYVEITWFFFKVCMRISKDNFFVSFAVTLFSSVFTGLFMVQRPFIFFIFIITIEIYLLESYIAEKSIKYLLPLPLLSIILVNIQAAMWPILFILLIPYIIDSFRFRLLFIKGEGYPKKAFFIITAIMILAGIINPYGIDGMSYLFRSYGYKEISFYVSEMKPPDINSSLGMIIFFVIFSVILVYCIFKKGDTKIRYVLLTIGTIIMTISSIRSFPIFCIYGIAPLAYYFRNVKVTEGKLWESGSAVSILVRRVLILCICVLIVSTIYGKYQGARKESQEALLPRAVDYILNNADIDNIVLYTGYDSGPYAEFMGLKPYIDTRAEVFVKKNNKKEDIMKEYVLLQSGNTYYRNVLDKYNFTHLIVSNTDILYNYLHYDRDYRMAYSNKEYRVFEKIN